MVMEFIYIHYGDCQPVATNLASDFYRFFSSFVFVHSMRQIMRN